MIKLVGQTHIALSARAEFRVKDGKITVWRDYFDGETLKPALPSGGAETAKIGLILQQPLHKRHAGDRGQWEDMPWRDT